uniref:Uncharacterized protein n=1 Tax=Sphaerodactylus townsendi TaxID=933632 RepID=A0ACB8EGA9_9SAUR
MVEKEKGLTSEGSLDSFSRGPEENISFPDELAATGHIEERVGGFQGFFVQKAKEEDFKGNFRDGDGPKSQVGNHADKRRDKPAVFQREAEHEQGNELDEEVHQLLPENVRKEDLKGNIRNQSEMKKQKESQVVKKKDTPILDQGQWKYSGIQGERGRKHQGGKMGVAFEVTSPPVRQILGWPGLVL